MPRETCDLGAAVTARLLQRARAERSDFHVLVIRSALKRLLYRLSVALHCEHFHSERNNAFCALGHLTVVVQACGRPLSIDVSRANGIGQSLAASLPLRDNVTFSIVRKTNNGGVIWPEM